MVNQQTLQGNWNQIAGKLRAKWGQLNQDELQHLSGNATELVGYIQRKTGEARDKVESFLDEVTSQGSATMHRATETVSDFASQAAQSAKQGFDHAARYAREGYASAERMVQERPGSTLAVAFGAGVLTGVILGLLIHSSRE
jgi:uncharacterized protein YjbJ (UPF0337 family)